MDHKPQVIWRCLDLLFPLAAILVMVFSLSTLFLDPSFHIPTKSAPEALKPYRNAAMR